eukprot:CAMPEP_0185024838 /NCGR_PEP_ID=MMETSP1103-20130426/8028_1 /TAXON_ID=36769 /ORGANISM="Paraphysomonas bandaiensis, Strain Caron Lab Isolate" /LENGTH=403 /DNA_ID=CAMNT_0027557903 /DNA_START=155 /DNA_END=1366 /DNA_ORIENTATION=+
MLQLKSGGVEGVMADCWWGLVESEESKYNFDPYLQLTQMAADAGLKMQYVMSFHRCGGNVGDTCNYPLPDWVLNSADDIWYEDQHGNKDTEYVALFADNEAVLGSANRTPLQVYENFMSAFKSSLSKFIGSTVVEIQVGAGPAGELRYPSYQMDKWEFCGVGEFQSYSPLASSSLQAAANEAGHPEWGTPAGPSNAGSYNSHPSDSDASFFSPSGENNYSSEYGQFYLGWYTDSLLRHGQALLDRAGKVFDSSVRLSLKVAGIHWWYLDASHAAELTAGYWNIEGDNGRDVYGEIASMVSAVNATFDFTCLEMKDSEQPAECLCGPYELVQQTKQSAINYKADYSGENALQRYDQTAYDTIKSQSSSLGHNIDAFTYLRLTDDLLSGSNWNTFTQFVNDMRNL